MAMRLRGAQTRTLRDAERWERMSFTRRLVMTFVAPDRARQMYEAYEQVATIRAATARRAERPALNRRRLSGLLGRDRL